MTVSELLEQIGGYPGYVAAFFAAFPLLVLLLRAIHGKGEGASSPWKYCHSAIVFGISLPGVCAGCVVAIALVFGSASLFDQKISTVAICIAPVLSMILTLTIMAKVVDLDKVPGFDRVTSLIAILGVSFIAVLLLRRLHIFVLTGLWGMLGAGALFYVVLRWGLNSVIRTPGEGKGTPPTISKL
jgi:hypothetical protein